MSTPNSSKTNSDKTPELSYLEILPLEIFNYTMLKMDIIDILNVGNTSRSLYARVSLDDLWVQLISRDFGQSEVDGYHRQQYSVFGKARAKDFYRFLIEKKTMSSNLLNEVDAFCHAFLYFLDEVTLIRDEKDHPSDAVEALKNWLKLTDNEKTAALANILSQVETLVSFLASSTLKGTNGETLFDLAVIYNHTALATALLKKNGMKVNQQGGFGNTILSVAASNGKAAIVNDLLARNDIDINIPNTNGNTPLHLAVMNRHTDVVNTLFHHKNIDINLRNENGDTPLHLAIKHDHNGMVQKFLTRKVINANIQNNDGNTPLKIALKNRNFKISLLIIKHRLNLSKYVLLGQGVALSAAIMTGLSLFFGFQISIPFTVVGSLLSAGTTLVLVGGLKHLYKKEQQKEQPLIITPDKPTVPTLMVPLSSTTGIIPAPTSQPRAKVQSGQAPARPSQ